MSQLHNLRPGDRIALLYPSIGTSSHSGTVAHATPTSVSIQIDGLLRPKRFFFTRENRWLSEFGHAVSVDRISPTSSPARHFGTSSKRHVQKPGLRVTRSSDMYTNICQFALKGRPLFQ